MSDRFALAPGLQLQEYVIEGVLGFGGFGITYKATDLALKSTVAIKEYFPSSLAVRDNTSAVRSKSAEEDKDYRWGLRRFISEARTLAKFKHDNIVRVLRSFPENNTAYMVLEYVEGKNMESWLKDLGRSPTQEELDRITKPILEALSLVHEENIFHRDVKPKNIYIRKEDSSPVLLDFGAARYGLSEHTASTAAIVSRFYSPYECYAADSKMQGPWTDIYGMAATLHRAIRGAPPAEATNRVIQDDYQPLSTEETLQGNYRPAFLRAVDAGLAVFPRDRPQTVVDWLTRLEGRGDAVPVAPVEIPTVSPEENIRTPTRSWLGTGGLIAAASLSAVIGIAYPYFTQKPAEAPQKRTVSEASAPLSQKPSEEATATPDGGAAKTQGALSTGDAGINAVPPQREETRVAAASQDEPKLRQNEALNPSGTEARIDKDDAKTQQNEASPLKTATGDALSEPHVGPERQTAANLSPSSSGADLIRQTDTPAPTNLAADASKNETNLRQSDALNASGNAAGTEARMDKVDAKMQQNEATLPKTAPIEHHDSTERLMVASLSPSSTGLNPVQQANTPGPKDLDPEHIKWIQNKLVDKGCLKAEPSGVWDENSKGAWRQLASASGKANVPVEPTQALYDALFNIEGSCIRNDKPGQQKTVQANAVEPVKQPSRPKAAEQVRRSRPERGDAGHSSQPRIGGVSIGAGGLNF